MLDFDDIDNWAPDLANALRRYVPEPIALKVAAAAPVYVEDARDLLLNLADREAIIDATLSWIRSTKVVGYHGSRLVNSDIASIRRDGLVPLNAESRRGRLTRVLSRHARWHAVKHQLDAVIESHGEGGAAGSREGQMHLTLSRAGLTEDFNHYLTHGSEFDQRVASALLDSEGEELLAQDGESTLVQVAVPGSLALAAAHPYLGIDDLRAQGSVPNLVTEFLNSWSYRLAHPGFQCRSLEIDCGMVFHKTVPTAWILSVDKWGP